MQRFRESGHGTISAMIGNHEVEYPKIGGKEVCLTWALKGSCVTGCKRKDLHVRYGRPTIQKLHALMDACGVANSQP